MNDFAALSRMLENLIRFGVIANVQMEPPRVQVKTGKLTTAWPPWAALRARSDREWAPPTEGEQVILFSPSGQLANGIAVTGMFSDHIPANGNRAGLHRRTQADGTVIEYDSIAHHLNATLVDGGTTNIVGPITHQGDYTQTGNQSITGKVDVVAAGISLVTHPHGDVKFGNDISLWAIEGQAEIAARLDMNSEPLPSRCRRMPTVRPYGVSELMKRPWRTCWPLPKAPIWIN